MYYSVVHARYTWFRHVCTRLCQVGRISDAQLRLVGDLAAITSTLTMSFADLLFQITSGEPADRLQRQYHDSLQAVDIINDL
jgi:hypothetical protein